MKRKLALLTCSILTASLLFSGCSTTPADETSSQAESSASESSTVNESASVDSSVAESATTESVEVNEKHLDPEWLEKVTELYLSKIPDRDSFANVYAEGIRGDGSYAPEFNDTFAFYYHTMEGQRMCLNIDPVKEKASIDLDISYADGSRMYTVGKFVGLDEIEAYVDALANGTAKYKAYDSSALENNAEKLKRDIPIMYARLIVLSDHAFPELNMTLEDYGIDLGDKYRAFDPTQKTSAETVITNEHKFENGVCKDCGMKWTKYANRTLAAFDGELIQEEDVATAWFSTYGQDSVYEELLGGGYVQYSTSDALNTKMLFYHYGDPSKTFIIQVSQDGIGNDSASISYVIEEKYLPIDEGAVDAKYKYCVNLSANLGGFDKIFASKEAFWAACSTNLIIYDENDHSMTYAWAKMKSGKITEDEIRKLFEADGYTYYTQEELLNMFWEDHVNLLKALDAGMEWFDTTLEDAGINYQ